MLINEIMKYLPHRYPMLLVDRILEIGEGRIVGLKNVTANEPFFQGHFPGAPIMPGVLIIESLAQCGAVLFAHDMPDRDDKIFYFGGIDKARFRKPVIPGDQLILEVTTLQKRAGTARLKGVARVEGNIVAEAEFLSVLGPRPA
ncbi:MAG TPA: 3-hydroxyacyl-ACP dehydratase FabZ [Thermoanaerobaculia bacterium]|nr:3-hydroxyacyl-ACP dehydratase FabZ [Thermoanaerobaculia bacterium]